MVSLTVKNPPQALNMIFALCCIGFAVGCQGAVTGRPFQWKTEREARLQEEERKKAEKAEDEARDRVWKQADTAIKQAAAQAAQQEAAQAAQQEAAQAAQQEAAQAAQQAAAQAAQQEAAQAAQQAAAQQPGPAIPWAVPAVHVDEAGVPVVQVKLCRVEQSAAAPRKRNCSSALDATGETKKAKVRGDYTNPRR